MKDCKKLHPLLSLYQEGELSAREKTVVEKHVSGCPVARAELERLERLHRTLRKLPEPKVPDDLHEKIMARLGRKTEPERKVLWFNPTWMLAAAAACLALIFLTQYPRWSGSHNENLAMGKVVPAPSAPSPSKDNSTVSGFSAGVNAHQAIENKPMVMALRAKVAKKKEGKREISSNVDFRLGNSTANDAASSDTMGLSRKSTGSSDIGISSPVSTQPTMVLALGLPAAKEYAEEPKRAKKEPERNLSIARSDSSQFNIRTNISAASPAAPAEAAPPVQMQASVKASSAPMTYTPEQPQMAPPQQPQTIWSGSYSPVTVESQELIIDTGTFQVEWTKVQPNQPIPPVDFTTQAMVLLNAGNQPTTGYSIQVSRLEETADQLIVHYQITSPPTGAVTGQMVTRPWAMQVIPKPVKPVIFIQDRS